MMKMKIKIFKATAKFKIIKKKITMKTLNSSKAIVSFYSKLKTTLLTAKPLSSL
jgi:hypothetical protein